MVSMVKPSDDKETSEGTARFDAGLCRSPPLIVQSPCSKPHYSHLSGWLYKLFMPIKKPVSISSLCLMNTMLVAYLSVNVIERSQGLFVAITCFNFPCSLLTSSADSNPYYLPSHSMAMNVLSKFSKLGLPTPSFFRALVEERDAQIWHPSKPAVGIVVIVSGSGCFRVEVLWKEEREDHFHTWSRSLSCLCTWISSHTSTGSERASQYPMWSDFHVKWLVIYTRNNHRLPIWCLTEAAGSILPHLLMWPPGIFCPPRLLPEKKCNGEHLLNWLGVYMSNLRYPANIFVFSWLANKCTSICIIPIHEFCLKTSPKFN